MPNDMKHGTSTPVPDPTLLTTAALTREISALKELVTVRFMAMDKAMEIFSNNITRVPTDTDKQIGHLKELMQETFKLSDEKFSSIQIQFQERDVRTEQTARDSKVAVDAALQAAKEAVGEQNKSSALAIAKSETSTNKQIDQQAVLITSATQGLNDKIDDVKERMTRIESENRGSKEVKDDSKSQMALIISGVVGIVAVGGVLYGALRPAPVAQSAPSLPQLVYIPTSPLEPPKPPVQIPSGK